MKKHVDAHAVETRLEFVLCLKTLFMNVCTHLENYGTAGTGKNDNLRMDASMLHMYVQP